MAPRDIANINSVPFLKNTGVWSGQLPLTESEITDYRLNLLHAVVCLLESGFQ